MSWTLFIQIVIFLIVGGAIGLVAYAFHLAGNQTSPSGEDEKPKRLPIQFISTAQPQRKNLQHGDTWLNPESNVSQTWTKDGWVYTNLLHRERD